MHARSAVGAESPGESDPRTRYARYAAVIQARRGGPEWEEAWTDFVRDYTPVIRGVADAMNADPDEVMSDAILHLWNTLPDASWDETDRFTPYLRTIVRNLVYTGIRKRVRGHARGVGGTAGHEVLANHAAPGSAPDPTRTRAFRIDSTGYGELLTALMAEVHKGLVSEFAFDSSHAARLAAIEAALEKVKPHNREAIYRLYTGGVRGSVTDVARSIGRTVGAVQQLKDRFEERLAAALKAQLTPAAE
jgi:RNA polymerase sigma factor (sigma-70 family)